MAEDQDLVRQAFVDFLEMLGYCVRTAVNGRMAWEECQQKLPDLLLTDLFMPEMDGFELIEKVVTLSPITPIIVISGADSVEDVVRALSAGAWDYIAKPISSLNLLKHTLSKNLERREHLVMATKYQKLLTAVEREQQDENITTRNVSPEQLKKQLRQSQKEWRRTVDILEDLIVLYDTEHIAVRLNRAMAQKIGISITEAIGSRVCLFDQDDFAVSEVSCLHEKVMLSGKEQQVKVTDKTGTTYEIRVFPFLDEISGDITGSVFHARDITLHQELQSSLASRTLALEARTKELETFTYSVSHDLKAPLRGIDGYSQLLSDEYTDSLDDEGKLFLKNIRNATIQMNQLIEDLLLYSRVEHRDFISWSIEIQPLLDILLQERERDLNVNNTQVKITVPFKQITGDKEGLRQVLGNLLDNAIKFSQKSVCPSIEISGEETEDHWILRVKDNGVGFDPKFQDKIFGIFQRLHVVDEYPGTGIGLAIVEKAIMRMGGTISAEGEPGLGATFSVKLPKPNGS
ncbi:ATP-binding protein [Desulfosediminicola flagellatus]|uniref:ATP-binding protein n=1 Tax=Desulfosediminicola flagellatus TaxID=2569541 RepID=UPI0010AB8785|nr:ATP-binding protein [Desulfosediminicola flagellatus]